MTALKSAIYEGEVYHARLTPKKHAFKYKVFMLYLDLSETDNVFSQSRLWGASALSLARFNPKDFYTQNNLSISDSIKALVQEKLGFYPSGTVRILANLRYFGYIMNPLVMYYCYDKSGDLVAMVAEVNNTPWNEKHPYVLDCRENTDKNHHVFKKEFTVSPFNPIDMTYHWTSNTPCDALNIHIENTQKKDLIFKASLALTRVEITPKVLRQYLILYPFFTVKVITAIYWQALKLYLKGVPFLGKNYRLSE